MVVRTEWTSFDVICGMWLKTAQVATTYTYLGQTYAFCCQECCDIFARVRQAHEPSCSAGHRCPHQRLDDSSSVARPEQETPAK